MGQVTKEAFEQDKVLKEKFGSYENYLSQNGGNSDSKSSVVVPNNSEVEGGQNPTFNDYVSVENSGKLPEEEPKSAYDMYMEEAKNIYNQGVETNNKNAANQAASAGAQYREVNRNVGEINKANGKADTGYAGDTSIDAYNSYRNNVNKIYSDATSANNELYSYYLSEMAKLQQAKDSKEATDRQLEQTDRQLDMQEKEFEYNKEMSDRQMELQEREYNDNKAREVAENIEVIKGENPYDADGKIKPTIARKIYEYLLDVYGEAENIPDSVIANVNTENGFKEYVDAYNNGEAETLETKQKNKEKVENIVAGNETIEVNYGTTNEQYSGGYLRSGEFKLGEKLSKDDSVLYSEEFKTALKDLDYFTDGDAKSERLRNGYTVRVDTKNGWYFEVVLSSIYGFFTGGDDIADPYDHNYYTYYDGNWYKSSKVG